MPRTPSGNAITHSPASSISRHVSGVPDAAPPRAAYTDTHGSCDTQYSSMPRTMRGGSASSSIATEIIGQSYEARDDVDKLLDDAERLIFQISERRMQGSAFPVRAILKDTFEHIEKLYDRKEHITGLATGFDDLDRMTSGLQPSDFIIIAGRPSMGKTAFALNIAKFAGIEDHKRVLVLSLEMSKEQLVLRMLCAEAKVDSHKVRTGYLDPRDWTRLTNAAGLLWVAPV